MNNKEKIKKLEEIREDYFAICGYEKDFNEAIKYKIMELEKEKGVLNDTHFLYL